jgi:hypothetical protein
VLNLFTRFGLFDYFGINVTSINLALSFICPVSSVLALVVVVYGCLALSIYQFVKVVSLVPFYQKEGYKLFSFNANLPNATRFLRNLECHNIRSTIWYTTFVIYILFYSML